MSNNNARIFIRRIPPKTNKTEIWNLCQRYGKVLDVDKQGPVAWVTFSKRDVATLALFHIPNSLFKGRTLECLWAIERRDEQEGEQDDKKKEETPQVQEDQKNESKATPARIIPGSEVEKTTPSIPQNPPSRPNTQAKVPSPAPVPAPTSVPVPIPVIVPAPVPAPVPVPSPVLTPIQPPQSHVAPHAHAPSPSPSQASVNSAPHQTNTAPSDSPFEITIRDTSSRNILYQFPLSSLANLESYLLAEAGPDFSSSHLFLASAPPKSDTVKYRGLPVIHIYSDSLSSEFLESKDNLNQRKKDFRSRTANSKSPLPPPNIPLSKLNILVSEVEDTLKSSGYQQVFINLDPRGTLAPLSPGWLPLPRNSSWKKGKTIVSVDGSENRNWEEDGGGVVCSCSFINSTKGTFDDLSPLLSKYGVAVVNVEKLTFITPGQKH